MTHLLLLLLMLGLSLFTPPQQAVAQAQPSAETPGPCSSFPVSAVNPGAISNPEGAAFPGVRGPNQLVLYNAGYESKRTHTNEYGAEIVIKDGRVDEITGANSFIYQGQPVLSGHGRAARWLLRWGKVGNTVKIEDATATICQSPDAAAYQTQQRLRWIQQDPRLARMLPPNADALSPDALEEAVAASVGTFHGKDIRAVWHRPTVENSSVASIQNTLKQMKARGLNAVFLETFFHGWPIYPSGVYTRYGLENDHYPKLGVRNDEALLARWVRLAHREGMQVHAWVQVFYVGNTALKVPSPILKKYPNWANRQRRHALEATPQPSDVEAGHWFMDPAHPQVQQFLLELMDELATTTAIDGIQLDYIRYPAPSEEKDAAYLASTWGYTPVARRAFMRQHGADPLSITPKDESLWRAWATFKTQQVTQLVAALHARQQGTWQNTRKRKGFPRLQLSAAVFPDARGPMSLKHQNWPDWIQQGYLNFLSPMVLSPNAAPVCEALETVEQVSAQTPVVIGLFSPFFETGRFAQLQQLQAASRCGASGYAWFQSQQLLK